MGDISKYLNQQEKTLKTKGFIMYAVRGLNNEFFKLYVETKKRWFLMMITKEQYLFFKQEKEEIIFTNPLTEEKYYKVNF